MAEKVCGMCGHGICFGFSQCFGAGWCGYRLQEEAYDPVNKPYSVDGDTPACDKFQPKR